MNSENIAEKYMHITSDCNPGPLQTHWTTRFQIKSETNNFGI